MSYPHFGILAACVPGWSYHLLRNIYLVSTSLALLFLPNVAFITAMDACELKIPQANYKQIWQII
jgi:hypothetical protein